MHFWGFGGHNCSSPKMQTVIFLTSFCPLYLKEVPDDFDIKDYILSVLDRIDFSAKRPRNMSVDEFLQ